MMSIFILMHVKKYLFHHELMYEYSLIFKYLDNLIY